MRAEADSAGDLAGAVAAANACDDLRRAVAELYRQVDADVAAAGVRCLGGGCCCKFDIAGHRLYASTAELAVLLQCPPPRVEQAARMRCPYQRGPRCLARDGRPLGCRVFFCRADASQLSPMYERYHQLLRQLHDRHAVPYFYAEITSAIRQLIPE